MKEITVDDLKQRLVAGETITVVDIREPDEYNDWHICGAVNVPVYNAINAGERLGSWARRARSFQTEERGRAPGSSSPADSYYSIIDVE